MCIHGYWLFVVVMPMWSQWCMYGIKWQLFNALHASLCCAAVALCYMCGRIASQNDTMLSLVVMAFIWSNIARFPAMCTMSMFDVLILVSSTVLGLLYVFHFTQVLMLWWMNCWTELMLCWSASKKLLGGIPCVHLWLVPVLFEWQYEMSVQLSTAWLSSSQNTKSLHPNRFFFVGSVNSCFPLSCSLI